ncbi:MAG: hypothetical protein JWL77_2110, partial [Chthonomonadaceae bacterium]|nr:hypothetical protein [Chthonomonadaceae bacterium]
MRVLPQGLRSCLVALVLAVLCVPASADDLSKTGLFRERVLPILRE